VLLACSYQTLCLGSQKASLQQAAKQLFWQMLKALGVDLQALGEQKPSSQWSSQGVHVQRRPIHCDHLLADSKAPPAMQHNH